MNPFAQFAMVAGAHFLALLSPGPDFFLIVRSSMRQGRHAACSVCAGIALANGIYITLALTGFALLRESGPLFVTIRWAGCFYLGWRGLSCLRATPGLAGITETSTAAPLGARRQIYQAFASGFLSAILNPKNALFYATLFSILISTGSSPAQQLAYGVWMFTAVLLWDLAVARALSHPAVMARFLRRAHHIERFTGFVLLGIAAMVLIETI